MTADATAAIRCHGLDADDPRAMLPIEEVAVLLSVSVALLKRQHHANPVEYPAERVGTLWRIPRWWVARKISCQPQDVSA